MPSTVKKKKSQLTRSARLQLEQRIMGALTPLGILKAPPSLLCALCLIVQTSHLCPILHKHTRKNILKSEYLNRYNINTTFAEYQCVFRKKKKKNSSLDRKTRRYRVALCASVCVTVNLSVCTCIHAFFFGCNLNFLGLDKRQE